MKIKGYGLILLVIFLLLALSPSLSNANEKWSGVDETVVESFAEKYNRGAKGPLINTDQGDLLLFVFFLAGSGGGFLAGYSWRRLLELRA